MVWLMRPGTNLVGPAGLKPALNTGKSSSSSSRSEEHTSELQSPCNLVCRLLLEKKKTMIISALPSRTCPRLVTGGVMLTPVFALPMHRYLLSLRLLATLVSGPTFRANHYTAHPI